jgi:hypothetical protein
VNTVEGDNGCGKGGGVGGDADVPNNYVISYSTSSLPQWRQVCNFKPEISCNTDFPYTIFKFDAIVIAWDRFVNCIAPYNVAFLLYAKQPQFAYFAGPCCVAIGYGITTITENR